MTWILLCLCLATSLLKIRRNRWRLVLKIKGRKVRKIWKMGKQSRLEQLRSVSCVIKVFWFMDGPISRRLAQDVSYPLITTLQQECTRASCPETKAGELLYLCVAHGNNGAMEVCFVHNTTSTVDLTFCFLLWEALSRYRLHFTYRRQRDCLVKVTTYISIQVWQSPHRL